MERAPGAEEATQSWARLRNDRRLEFGVEIAALAVLAILCVLIIKPFVTAALWLFKQGATAWGVFMLAWGIVAIGGVDTAAKPLLISRGGNTPLILVMLGLLGGASAFGFIGVFLGPTLLALGYNLLDEWSSHSAAPGNPANHAELDAKVA
jgi:predicted PurR-regulated permease PerM